MMDINTVADSCVGDLSVALGLVEAASELFSPLSEKAVPNSADACAVYSRRHMIDSVLIAAHERVSSAKEALAETLMEDADGNQD